MPNQHSSLAIKAFGKNADQALIVAYQSHQDAMRFLAAALAQPNGIALLQGPAGSGKSAIIRAQRDWSALNSVVTLLDGAHLTPRSLMKGMLSQFGIESDSQPDELLLQQLNSHMTQQTRDGHAPRLRAPSGPVSSSLES